MKMTRREILAAMAAGATQLGIGSLAGVPVRAGELSRGWTPVQESFSDWRFGMFVHWGPVALSGGREIGWGRKAFRPGVTMPVHPYEVWQQKSDPYYDTLYRRFLPAPDYAAQLAETAKAAGMKYIVLTTKHHDGYPLFRTDTIGRSGYSDFAHTPLGRSGRDLVREFADATRDAGLKVGFYYSQQDWSQPDFGRGDYARYLPYLKRQLEELLTERGKVDVLWYDALPPEPLKTFDPPWLLDQPRRWQPGLVINNRAYSRWMAAPDSYDTLPQSLRGDFDTPEQKIGAFQIDRPWESCVTITPNQWAWKPEAPCMSANEVIANLVRTATGGGNFLLNIGPDPMGYIEPTQVATLRGVGDWLAVHGEAIYRTRGGPFRRTDLGGSTYRGNAAYVQVLANPEGRALELPGLAAKLLGATTFDERKLGVRQSEGRIEIDLAGMPWTEPVMMLKLFFERDLTTADISPLGMGFGINRPT